MKEIHTNRVILLGLSGLLLAVVSKNSNIDLDVFQELALIRAAVAEGGLPRADVFSYVPTLTPMVHHEWGTGAILYFLVVTCGLGAAGLVLVKLALIAGIGVACYLCARRSGAEAAVTGPLAVIAIFLGSIAFTNVRAQLFTLLFLAVLFLLLQEDWRGRRWWIALWLPLYVAWVNVHGGAVLGIALVLLHGLERAIVALAGRTSPRAVLRRMWHLPLVAAGMTALLLVNPYGWHGVAFLWRSLTLDRSPWIAEWHPLWRMAGETDTLLRAILFVPSAVIALYAIARTGRYRALGVAFLLIAACQAALHYRHLSVYAVAWLCVVPTYVEGTALGRALQNTWDHKRRAMVSIWAVIFFYGCGYAVLHQFWRLRVPSFPETASGDAYPAGAVDYLRNRSFRGNLMTPYNAGSYVLWKLYPEVKVSLDSRFEVAYPTAWVVDVALMYAGREGWQDTLARYPTDAVLVPRGEPLERLLADPPTAPAGAIPWRRVYRDDAYSLFARADFMPALPCVDRTGTLIQAAFP